MYCREGAELAADLLVDGGVHLLTDQHGTSLGHSMIGRPDSRRDADLLVRAAL